MPYSRNNPWMIAVNALEALRTYVPLLFAYSLSQSQIKGPPGVAVTVLFWLYSCLGGCSIVTRWVTRQFTFDKEGIKFRQGLFSRIDVFLPWSSVAAIEVHKDPVRGIAGCCKVIARASSGTDREIALDVVRFALVDEIQRLSGLPVSATRECPDSSPSAKDGSVKSELVFAASRRDLVVMSLAYGRFALFIPFVAGAYLEFAEMAGLPDPEWIIARGLSGGLATQLAWLTGFAVVSLAYGYAVTLLRFWKFRASIAGGSLLLEGGLLTSRRRAIPLDAVMGLALRRNVFELLTGRGRLALLTRDADQALGKDVVLPALKMSEIEARGDAFGGGARALLALDRASMRVGRVWWIAGTRVILALGGFAMVLTASGLWRYYAAAAAFVIPLCLLMVNACFTVLSRDQDGESILYRRGVMWRSSFSLPVSEVRIYKSETRPWDRWIGLRRMSLYYFSGATRRLFAWQFSAGRSVALGGDESA